MAARPTGLVTFLFTDIEGSSVLWQSEPDAMAEAVEEHDIVMRRRIDAFDGYVFGTAGDSFSAAFSSATAALSCAAEIQRDLVSDAWRASIRLRVRMGLHVGESIERDGGYFGPTLNTIGRLHGVAHGGQIVASGAVAALVDAPPPPTSWRALGLHRLKDVLQPMSVFQLCHPDLPQRFPSLRTTAIGNVPVETTKVVGRDEVIQRIRDALLRERLISVVGPGGAGKTTVAKAAVRRLRVRPSGGSWWLHLASLRTSDDIARALLEVVAPGRVGGGVGDLVDVLCSEPRVILLDEAESALGGLVPVIDAVLDADFAGSLLVTSRRTVGVAGEVVVSLRGLVGADAQRYFTRCVVRSGGTSPSDDVIATLCERAGGLPLAIQLAAAHTSGTALDVASDPESGRRRADRETELDHIVHATLDVVPHDTATIVERCSVWPRWFDRSDATAIARDLTIDVDETLADAARHALLTVERHENRIRYHILEPIREIARDRLEQRGDLERTLRAATAATAERMTQLGEMFADDRDVDAAIELDERIDDLGLAHGRAVDDADPIQALACVGPLIMPCYCRAMYWLRPLCESALGLPGAAASPHFGHALAIAAWSARSQGDLDAARSMLDAALVEPQERDLPSVVALARGWVHVADHEVAGADHRFEEGVELARREAPAYLANALAQNALRSTYFGRQAAALGRAAAAVADAAGNAHMRAFCQFARAESVWRTDPSEAADAYRASIDLATRFGFVHTHMIAMIGASALQARSGDHRTAAGVLVESIQGAITLGARTVQLPVLENAADVLARAGDDDGAVTIWHALRSQTGTGSTPEQAEALQVALHRIGSHADEVRRAAEYLDLRSLCAFAIGRLERITAGTT